MELILPENLDSSKIYYINKNNCLFQLKLSEEEYNNNNEVRIYCNNDLVKVLNINEYFYKDGDEYYSKIFSISIKNFRDNFINRIKFQLNNNGSIEFQFYYSKLIEEQESVAPFGLVLYRDVYDDVIIEFLTKKLDYVNYFGIQVLGYYLSEGEFIYDIILEDSLAKYKVSEESYEENYEKNLDIEYSEGSNEWYVVEKEKKRVYDVFRYRINLGKNLDKDYDYLSVRIYYVIGEKIFIKNINSNYVKIPKIFDNYEIPKVNREDVYYKILEYFRKVRPDLDIKRGSEVGDIIIEPLYRLTDLFSVYLEFLNYLSSIDGILILLKDKSLMNYFQEKLSYLDIKEEIKKKLDFLGRLYGVERFGGKKARGVIRLLFNDLNSIPIVFEIKKENAKIKSKYGLNYVLVQDYVVYKKDIENNYDDVLKKWYYDIEIEAEDFGVEYNIEEGEIVSVEGIDYISGFYNFKVFGGMEYEDDYNYASRIRNKVLGIDLVSWYGIYNLIVRTYDVYGVKVVGAGDNYMLRDYNIVLKDFLGGCVDVYYFTNNFKKVYQNLFLIKGFYGIEGKVIDISGDYYIIEFNNKNINEFLRLLNRENIVKECYIRVEYKEKKWYYIKIDNTEGNKVKVLLNDWKQSRYYGYITIKRDYFSGLSIGENMYLDLILFKDDEDKGYVFTLLNELPVIYFDYNSFLDFMKIAYTTEFLNYLYSDRMQNVFIYDVEVYEIMTNLGKGFNIDKEEINYTVFLRKDKYEKIGLILSLNNIEKKEEEFFELNLGANIRVYEILEGSEYELSKEELDYYIKDNYLYLKLSDNYVREFGYFKVVLSGIQIKYREGEDWYKFSYYIPSNYKIIKSYIEKNKIMFGDILVKHSPKVDIVLDLSILVEEGNKFLESDYLKIISLLKNLPYLKGYRKIYLSDIYGLLESAFGLTKISIKSINKFYEKFIENKYYIPYLYYLNEGENIWKNGKKYKKYKIPYLLKDNLNIQILVGNYPIFDYIFVDNENLVGSGDNLVYFVKDEENHITYVYIRSLYEEYKLEKVLILFYVEGNKEVKDNIDLSDWYYVNISDIYINIEKG